MAFAEPTNLTSLKSLFDYADSVTGFFYLLLPVSLFFTIFFWLKRNQYDTSDSLLASSFTTTISSVFIYLLGGISGTQFFYVAVVMVVSAIYAWATKQN